MHENRSLFGSGCRGMSVSLCSHSGGANLTAETAKTFRAGHGLVCVPTASSTADGTAASLPAVAHQPLARW